MPIRVDYSPVGTLMNLARSAGEAQGARESATHDLAFTQMAMQAQTQNAQIASTIRRNDQAFQLQQAALSRQARTPTRVAAARGPVTQEFDRVLGRMVTTRAWTQEDRQRQLDQLGTLEATGQYTPAEIEGERLRIMAGRATGLPIKKEKPEIRGLTAAQQESRRRTLFTQRRDDLEEERKRILAEQEYADFERTTEWQTRLDAATKAIQKHDTQYRAGITAPGTISGDVTPKPMPTSKADLVVGETYVAADGRIERWDGSQLIEVAR